jgi:hypothetical protein
MVELQSLQAALEAPRERRAPPSEVADGPADGLVASILARHQHSAQPHSQQLCAILTAVLEVLKAEGLQATPTALYAALMSSLEKPETLQNSEVSPWLLADTHLVVVFCKALGRGSSSEEDSVLVFRRSHMNRRAVDS